nr:MupG family TIM beta-alpha barrel fold protein [Mammaliicoccus sp. Marseille-Q6498]
MLGFSVYLGERFDESYIESMLCDGFKYIFTSLQIPEDDQSLYLTQLKKLHSIVGDRAEIIADANPDTFKKLGLSYDEPGSIREAGIDFIRLDISLDVNEIVSLLNEVKVVCNASTDAISLLHRLKEKHVDLSKVMVAHNYYPRPETGLARDFFISQNEKIKNDFPDVSIMAFVPGTKLRGPIFKGLPTLEDHRNIHPLVAAYDLLKCGVDDICIGDSYIDESILFQFKSYFQNGIVSLHVNSESEHLNDVIGRTFHNRKDEARDVVRAEEARQTFRNEVNPHNTTERVRGAITLDNVKYGRYMNELQIVKVHLERNEAVNVIGQVCEKDLDCINMIGSGQAFQFIKGDS